MQKILVNFWRYLVRCWPNQPRHMSTQTKAQLLARNEELVRICDKLQLANAEQCKRIIAFETVKSQEVATLFALMGEDARENNFKYLKSLYCEHCGKHKQHGKCSCE